MLGPLWFVSLMFNPFTLVSLKRLVEVLCWDFEVLSKSIVEIRNLAFGSVCACLGLPPFFGFKHGSSLVLTFVFCPLPCAQT